MRSELPIQNVFQKGWQRHGLPRWHSGNKKKVFGMAVDHLTGGGQMQSLVSAVKQFHVQLFSNAFTCFMTEGADR